jgi:hypothetical protein
LRAFRNRAVANAICLRGRTTLLFGNGVTKGCELRHKLGPLAERLVMLALYPIQCILLLVEGQISEPRDDGTHCKLSRHFKNLTMLENDGYFAVITGPAK